MNNDLTIPLTATIIGFALWAIVHEWRLWREFVRCYETEKKKMTIRDAAPTPSIPHD